MHALGFTWLLSKVLYVINFVLYRLAAWTGTLYLYRKAREKGRKIYYLLPVGVYAASWIMLLFTTHHLHWLHHLRMEHVAKLIHPFSG